MCNTPRQSSQELCVTGGKFQICLGRVSASNDLHSKSSFWVTEMNEAHNELCTALA